MVQRMMPKTYEAQYLMHLHESIIGIWILSMNTDIGEFTQTSYSNEIQS